MSTKQRFKSDAFESIHASATALRRAGAIDKTTMKDFDALAFVELPAIKPAQIKQLREKNRVSQPVFARFLNISESTVEKWETGAKKPSGMALKLLKIIEKHGISVLT